VVELTVASSQFRGSRAELFLIAGVFVAFVVVAVIVFVILNSRQEKTRRAGIAPVAALLDGRPVVAHSRGYTVQKNDRVHEFMRHQGRP
jgi:hypothetical protein